MGLRRTNEGLYVSHDEASPGLQPPRPARVHIGDPDLAATPCSSALTDAACSSSTRGPIRVGAPRGGLVSLRVRGAARGEPARRPGLPTIHPDSGVVKGAPSTVRLELSGGAASSPSRSSSGWCVSSARAPFGTPAPQLNIDLFDFAAASIQRLHCREGAGSPGTSRGDLLRGSQFVALPAKILARLTWSGACRRASTRRSGPSSPLSAVAESLQRPGLAIVAGVAVMASLFRLGCVANLLSDAFYLGVTSSCIPCEATTDRSPPGLQTGRI